MAGEKFSLYQITAPHFVAGLVVDRQELVTAAAPILKYMKDWRLESVHQYCHKKRWDVMEVINYTD